MKENGTRASGVEEVRGSGGREGKRRRKRGVVKREGKKGRKRGTKERGREREGWVSRGEEVMELEVEGWWW